MPAKFSLFTVAALPIIPIALACGGDDGGTITVRPDATRAADAAPVVCTASSSYTGVVSGSDTQFAGSGGTPGGMGSDSYEVYWAGRMDPTMMPDFLQVSLYEGFGAFSGGIVPATVQLTGDETAYSTCGACVFLFTDLYASGSDLMITDYYMPTGGTLQLSSVSGTFEGTLSNVTLQHLVVSGNDLVPANDGCTASIPNMTMNAEIEAQTMTAIGKESPGRKLNFKFKLPHRTF